MKKTQKIDRDIDKRVSKKKQIIRFAILYTLFFVFLSYLYIQLQENLNFLNIFTAEILFSLLKMLGMDISVAGSSLFMGSFSMIIIDECTGIYELIVYLACVLAYFTTPKKKFIGIAIGIPIILSINMVRLVFLAFIGVWFPDIFDYVHYYLWQVTLILLVALTVLIWFEKVVKK